MHRPAGRRRGAAAVEFVFVIPVYALLLFGVAMVGNRGLVEAQNHVAARVASWTGKGGRFGKEFIQLRSEHASIRASGPSKAPSGSGSQPLHWKQIYEDSDALSAMGRQIGRYGGQHTVRSQIGEVLFDKELPQWLMVRESASQGEAGSRLPGMGRIKSKKGSMVSRLLLVVPEGRELPSDGIRRTDSDARGETHPIQRVFRK